MQPAVQIDIWSDLACPWCYVGKRRLDKAMLRHKEQNFVIRWHPYMIDPATNKKGKAVLKSLTTGENYQAYNKRRWGSDGWTHSLRQSGQPDGAAFADWKWWPNTLDAHRLVHLAGLSGKDHQANELLFLRTYEQGGNISERGTLLQIGRELGLTGLEEYFTTDGGMAEVTLADAEAKQKMNIRSVPYFLVGAEGGKQQALSGAQPTEAFQQCFRKCLTDADCV